MKRVWIVDWNTLCPSDNKTPEMRNLRRLFEAERAAYHFVDKLEAAAMLIGTKVETSVAQLDVH